jgi:hypothetical protein
MAATPPPEPSKTFGVTKLHGQNQYYLVIITSSIYGTVQAWMPEDVIFDVSSNWDYIVGNFQNALASWVTTSATGKGVFSQYLSAQEWRGSTPLTLSIPLHFFATEDASNEVINPIKTLVKMALPRTGDGSIQSKGEPAGRLIPPGPRADPGSIGIITKSFQEFFGFKDTKTDQINVYIGNFVRLKGVFVDSVSNITFRGRLSAATGTDPGGLPMQGTLTVLFKTLYAPTAEDIDDYIMTGITNPNRPDVILSP